MNEERMLELKDNSLDEMGFIDVCTRTAMGIFALAIIWFASSLLIYMVR